MLSRKILTVFVLAVLVVSLFPAGVILAKGRPGAETASNNLSFPVIWAEGVTKALPGMPGMTPITSGVWWWWWGMEGVDPNIVPLACAPDPDDSSKCDDSIPGQATSTLPPLDDPDLVKAYLQKDTKNVWQAGSANWSASPVTVHGIDWGDNLESVDWYLTSQVRTEVVLFETLAEPMLEYGMRHTSGWGIDEVHGLAVKDGAVEIGPGTQATIYSNCARLTIQKLLVPRSDLRLADLIWVPGEGWTEPEGYPDLIAPHLFNGSVHEGGDGPGYYSAEINVKGRIIYGYTWNVKKLNQGAGDYRITFSFDQSCGTVNLNTYFTEGITQIIVPIETETILAESEPIDDGGGTAALDFANNLTYIDIHILQRGK